MHAYTFHEHELAVGRLAASIGFQQISLSHQIMSMFRIVPRYDDGVVSTYAFSFLFFSFFLLKLVCVSEWWRCRGFTTTVDAYLTPLIKRYIEDFSSGFDEGLASNVKISFMRSDGGLAPVDRFTGSSSILSGPAGISLPGFPSHLILHMTSMT